MLKGLLNFLTTWFAAPEGRRHGKKYVKFILGSMPQYGGRTARHVPIRWKAFTKMITNDNATILCRRTQTPDISDEKYRQDWKIKRQYVDHDGHIGNDKILTFDTKSFLSQIDFNMNLTTFFPNGTYSFLYIYRFDPCQGHVYQLPCIASCLLNKKKGHLYTCAEVLSMTQVQWWLTTATPHHWHISPSPNPLPTTSAGKTATFFQRQIQKTILSHSDNPETPAENPDLEDGEIEDDDEDEAPQPAEPEKKPETEPVADPNFAKLEQHRKHRHSTDRKSDKHLTEAEKSVRYLHKLERAERDRRDRLRKEQIEKNNGSFRRWTKKRTFLICWFFRWLGW